MNAKLDDIANSFAYLPEPRTSGDKGFAGPLAVGDATDSGHAATLGQVTGGAMNLGTDSGTANNYVVTMQIKPASYTDGMPLYFKPLNTNTGPSVVNVDGLGNVALKNANGEDLKAGDLKAGIYTEFIFDGTAFNAVKMLAGDRDYVDTQRDAAAASASSAATSEANASTSETNAASSEVAAQNWAEYPEDTPVPEGDGTEFSSKHWAKKVEAAVPAGGNIGQSIIKTGLNDYETGWGTLFIENDIIDDFKIFV